MNEIRGKEPGHATPMPEQAPASRNTHAISGPSRRADAAPGQPATGTPAWLAYAAALAGIALATFLRWGLGAMVGQTLSPFITFYPVVIFAALLGGLGPGLFATALSALTVDFFFLPPIGAISPIRPVDQVGLALFFGINLTVSLVAGSLRSARARAVAEARRASLSERRYRSFVEVTNQVIWRTNARGEVDQPIPSWSAFTGQTDEQAANFGWVNAIHPDDRPRVTQAWNSASSAKTLYQVEYRLRRHDGRWFHILARGVPILEPDGSVREYIGACNDITAQRQAEENLRRSEQKFRTIFEQAAIGMGRARLDDARWLDVNESFCQMLGYTPEFMRATPWPQITHPEDVELDLIPFRRMAAGELDSYSVEKRFLRADGHPVWARLTLSLVRDAEGRPDYEIAIVENIDARTRAEAQVQRQARLLDLSPTAIIVRNPEGLIIFWSAGAQALYGWTADEALGRFTHDLLQTEFPTPLNEIIPELRHGGKWSGELRQRTKDGAQVVVESHWLGQFGADGRVLELMESNMDVTARKQAEQTLQRRNQHLQLLHQASARLLVGQQPVALLRQLHGQMAQAFGADAFMLYQADAENSHLRLVACAGVTDEQQQKLETLRYGRAICAKPAEALQPIIATELQTTQAPNRRFLRKLGFRSYLYYPLILNNHLHGTVAFASHSRDDYDASDLDFFHTIAGTLAEALERERLESELHRHAADLEKTVQERTAKLRETLGELEGFSYSLVHDMRAPLRAMQGYASVLEEEAGGRLDPQALDYLRKIRLATDRMDHLITDSLNYSKLVRAELPLGPVNLGRLLRGMIETYPNLHEPQANIAIELGDLRVFGNEAALTQIFSNLLGNAVKFVAPGVHPRVRIWAQFPSPSPTLVSLWGGESRGEEAHALRLTHYGSPHPSHVLVCVEDNGIGIPRAHQQRIFGMFQRLHREREYPGTGIGLALVKKALERTGGQITLDSEPGRGSRFWVELPLASPASAAAQEEKDS